MYRLFTTSRSTRALAWLLSLAMLLSPWQMLAHAGMVAPQAASAVTGDNGDHDGHDKQMADDDQSHHHEAHVLAAPADAAVVCPDDHAATTQCLLQCAVAGALYLPPSVTLVSLSPPAAPVPLLLGNGVPENLPALLFRPPQS